MKLNIGCGTMPRAGYINVDREPQTNPDVLCDLGKDRWPFEDNSVEEVIAAHVLEHMTTDELFHCMKELHRVCKDRAIVRVVVPHPRHDVFLIDPTHQRPILPATMALFSKKHVEKHYEQGTYLTPFYKFVGVDFDMNKRVVYTIDNSLDEETKQRVEANLAFFEKHYWNLIVEIHMELYAVK